MLYDSLGMHANTLRNCSCCPPRFLCTLIDVWPPQIHMVRPILPCCQLPQNSYFSLPWDACSPSANAVSFLQLDLSLALSCSLNKNASTTQEWVRPLAQVDLMREGEGFSNLTVEIRLDGWLRFGVSSLTLTLIIKSPFNLHLTN
jgi:hypothetical protein